MNRAAWFASKWHWLKCFAVPAAVGAVLIAVGFAAQWHAMRICGALLLVPFVVWLALVPVLHWKERYIGGNSNLWGAFLVLETSSASKLLYWFVHVLPDWRRSGQYRDAI